jgi:acetoin utilization protein AcuB
MLIADWMTKDPITVTEDTSMMRSGKIMKENNIRRLPVVDENHAVIGIITDRDLKDASPSKATTLDIHELYYLLSEIKVKDIMTLNPITLSPRDTVEKAALLMNAKRVDGFPVVEGGKLVGIIAESDVFKVLTSITGVQFGGVQVAVELGTEPGALQGLLDRLIKNKARIMSLLTSYESAADERRQVFIRLHDMPEDQEKALISDLESDYKVLFSVRDHSPEEGGNPLGQG